MPEAGPPVNEPTPSTSKSPRSSSRGSMFNDPVVRGMAIAAMGLVVLFLVTVLGALVTGVMGETGPRSLAEKQVAVAGQAVSAGTRDAGAWGDYIAALADSGQYSRAKRAVSEARRSVDDSVSAEFTLAEARILSAQKKHKEAIRVAERAQQQIQKKHDAIVKAGGLAGQKAALEGFNENYYEAALLIAYAHRELKEWDKAVAQFDVYIDKYPAAADILIDRGNAKAEAGDKAGAESDFKAALKFMPEDPEALAGLEKIGAAK